MVDIPLQNAYAKHYDISSYKLSLEDLLIPIALQKYYNILKEYLIGLACSISSIFRMEFRHIFNAIWIKATNKVMCISEGKEKFEVVEGGPKAILRFTLSCGLPKVS